ncbi:MAG: hypothetical protein ACREB3_04345 [Burkholderiales bacterium]
MDHEMETKPLHALWRFIGLMLLLVLLAFAWLAVPATGAEQMQGKTANATRMGGAVKVVHVLDNYDTYFDHPGWKPIEY